MLRIKLHFQRLSDISLGEIYDAIGIYVLWNGKSKGFPSYIGEGNILNRFNSHLRQYWAARPIEGVVALIDAPTQHKAKAFAELGEAALLEVANMTNRFPTHNLASGKGSHALRKLLGRADQNHRTIRLVCSGQDPLRAPSRPAMRTKKSIVLRDGNEGWGIDEFNWNAQRTLRQVRREI